MFWMLNESRVTPERYTRRSSVDYLWAYFYAIEVSNRAIQSK